MADQCETQPFPARAPVNGDAADQSGAVTGLASGPEASTATSGGTPQPVRVAAITSGKGGVGKTSVSVNMALSLITIGRRVMLLDADLGLGNVDVMLGIKPRYNISHVLSGERELDEVLVTGIGGLRIVPAASGLKRMASLDAAGIGRLVQSFSTLAEPLDMLFVDTAAGISEGVLQFAHASQDVIVVICDEPASLADAYALIKVLHREFDVERFHVISNMVSSVRQGYALFEKLTVVAERFLDVSLRFLGAVPYDEQLREAVRDRQAVVLSSPMSASARAFADIALRIEHWPAPVARGRLEFFVERLVQRL